MTQEFDVRDVLNRKQRHKNANAILNAIPTDQQNFNVVLLAFTDIIQSSFYQFLRAQAASQSDLKKKQDRINRMITKILEEFNDSDLDNVECMIVLSTAMIEGINRALVRQQQNGVSIRPELEVRPVSRAGKKPPAKE